MCPRDDWSAGTAPLGAAPEGMCGGSESPFFILVERFSAPNPTDSARFHYFYHVPPACQPVTHQRGRIWVARLVRHIH